MSLGKRKCGCDHCDVIAECCDSGWSLYDPKNKKCPHWLAGVKEWHKFCKEYNRGFGL